MGKEGDAVTLESSSRVINVLVVIDTEYVKSLPGTPSKIATAPTRLNGSTGQFMLCTGSRNTAAVPVTGQGTANLSFMANARDIVRFFGESIYGNADDAVILYRIKSNALAENEVFNVFVANAETITGAAFPNVGVNSTDGSPLPPVPAVNGPASFVNLSAEVKKAGTENYYVHFGLYTLDEKGEKQELFGYYDCDPTITVA